MVLAMCCDFRVMTGHRGMMSMNEVGIIGIDKRHG